MKKLLVYMENEEFVVERVNEFTHATKRFFATEDGLFEAIEVYKPVLSDYDIQISDELWAKVINFLNSEK